MNWQIFIMWAFMGFLLFMNLRLWFMFKNYIKFTRELTNKLKDLVDAILSHQEKG